MNIKQTISLFLLVGFGATAHSEPPTLEDAPRSELPRIGTAICQYYHQGQRQAQCLSSWEALLQERQDCEEYYHDALWRCTSHFNGVMWRWELDEQADSKRNSANGVRDDVVIARTPQAQSSQSGSDCTYMSCNYRNATPKTPPPAKIRENSSASSPREESSDTSEEAVSESSSPRQDRLSSQSAATKRNNDGAIQPPLDPNTTYEVEYSKLQRPQKVGIRESQELKKSEDLKAPQELRKPQELGQRPSLYGSSGSSYEVEYGKLQGSQ